MPGVVFFIATAILIGMGALALVGKETLTVRGGRLTIFTGVGPLGWTRSYAWPDFHTVREYSTRSSTLQTRGSTVICLEGARRAMFGSFWTQERRYFVLSVLRQMLDESNRSRMSTPFSRPR